MTMEGAGAAQGSRTDPVWRSETSTKAKSSIIMFSSLQGEGGLTTRQSGGRGRHTRGLAATSVSCEEAAPLNHPFLVSPKRLRPGPQSAV
ncbi:unnamed protein product [Pleuronectes platessa]|uniref:Uncharacterized protein n=1 Tax=Pleuronectes platessa TaxID=8262 RepID=A0A9N7TN78_PLEPL|nr:unnamed protein product [Pleuronectes platessa]